MASMTNTRAGLMLTSGAAALALSLAISTEKAQAQAFQASETIVSGSATRLPTGTGTETITIDSQTVVIDWTPSIDAATGNALDFLPTGAIATFQNNGSDNPGGNFAVLNRILPTQTGDVVVMDGTVISRIVDLQFGTSTPGGTIAFYSPTGILVGGNASFDVGNLILTTLEPDVASFENFFLNGGTMFLDAGDAQLAEIIINAGANITASAENSYFAAIGARVRMDGTADINGSHAYVAGRTVNLTFSNGLFDIEVPVGTARSGSVINLRGNVGGPSSTGAGDNHMIYAVARASDNPIDLLFRGNLGFDPAASAGVVNGEIILSANYDVFGRTVQNGSISEGIGAVFDAQPDPFASPIAEANITAAALSASSSLLAIGTDVVEFNAGESSIFVDGNLLLVGRERALARASEGTIDVTGDLLISARNYGLVGSEFQDPGLIDAVGGEAILEAFFNSDITIGGSALVTASARGGADAFNFVAGSATGGRALVAADGGTISILGDTTIDAGAAGATEISLITTGATSRGGEALAFAQNGGLLTLGGNVIIDTSAIGVNADTSDVSTGSDAIGGFSSLDVTGSDGGTIDIAGEVGIFSNALGGTSNGEGAGSLGQGGDAGIFIDGAGSVTIGGAVNQEANGRGGDNFGSGSGGEARGGSARTFLPAGGSLAVGGDLAMRADAFGGNGTGGGDAFGGAAGIEVLTGIAEIAGTAAASASAQGGNADFGFGGAGGNAFGGLAFIQATGTLAASATLNAGGASAFARASGGRGGAGDGSDFQPGRGGDGSGGDFATPNQAAPEFNNGAFVLAGGDNGNLAITGENVVVDASGEGGEGGSGSTGQAGGAGGVGQGGLAQAGSTLFGGDGSLGAGSVGFGGVTVEAGGIGGVGGTGDQTGDGGEGRGGSAAFSVRAGELTAGTVELLADGFGGDGGQGGSALGGDAGLLGGLGGVATLDSLLASALAEGGAGATGGDALGGEAFMAFEGLDLTVNNGALLDASGLGGAGATGNGGNATGGTSRLEVRDSTLELTGISRLGDQTAGGDGETGGEAIGGIIEFFAVNSAITALPDVEGFAGLLVGGGTIGGQGVLQGGAATGSAITVGIEGSTFSGGTLGIVADARGGTATGGESLGGAATGGTVSFSTNPSTIGLVGENVVSADAF
ncbi:MAG: hypothetical protein V2I39_03480, partial [Erythrobacter sp.]|nr:hypothetical protein [Erythrobacter sp.]